MPSWQKKMALSAHISRFLLYSISWSSNSSLIFIIILIFLTLKNIVEGFLVVLCRGFGSKYLDHHYWKQQQTNIKILTVFFSTFLYLSTSYDWGILLFKLARQSPVYPLKELLHLKRVQGLLSSATFTSTSTQS